MMSSTLPIPGPQQPKSGEEERATADTRHPQQKMCGQQEEAGERERSDGKSRDHKASSQPETADDIGGGNQQRDEGSDRSRIGGLEDGECRQAEGGESDRHREVAPC